MSTPTTSAAKTTTTPKVAAPKTTPKVAAAKTTTVAEPKINLGARQTTTYFPSVVVAGKTHSCPHTTYGHEQTKTAQKCARSLLAAAGK